MSAPVQSARRVSSRHGIAIGLALLYLLLYWSDLPTFGPGMDSMTYGVVSRHFLTTGDWLVPHYTAQAYANFFQHPPLGLWITAATMKIASLFVGSRALYADWILKVASSLAAAGCAGIVYLWGRRMRGDGFGALAVVVLLTSTRFVKYSKGLMLDPFLAFFSLWAVFLACIGRDEREGKGALSFVSGLSVAAAFLSKGLFAFAPLAVITFVSVLDLLAAPKGSGTAKRAQARLGLFLVGVAMPLVLWLGVGNGVHYLAQYWREHVAERLGPYPFVDHLAPALNLLKVWWPWWPFFVLGLVRIVRARVGGLSEFLRTEPAIVAMTALAFLGGFSLTASFLEQYHVSTYAFAALIVPFGIPGSWARFKPVAERFLLSLVIVAWIVSLAKPSLLHQPESSNPLRVVLKEAAARCALSDVRRITISTGVAEIWFALAVGGWNTPWDPHSAPAAQSPEAGASQLLLADGKETPGAGWKPTGIREGPFVVYEAPGAPRCENSG